MSPLAAFLARNSVVSAGEMPLVHSTKSYNLRAILESDSIEPQTCNVFLNEKLNYFFVGRPAYKYDTDSNSAEEWELPCCFIFKSDIVMDPKRIFPFDSGAFSRGLYPKYIGMMPRDNFQVNEKSAIGNLIGSYFGSVDKYFGLKPKSREEFEKEYSLTVMDAEILAAHHLSEEKTIRSFDDRRFTIEMQSTSPVRLSQSKPIAVVLPESYLDIEHVKRKIEDEWGAEPLGYPIYPLSVSAYYALIYKEVHRFYKDNGYI